MGFTWNSKLGYYVIALIISLFILFFTGTSLTDLRTDGISYFRKGLDVAGGVRLTYKVDMSKYREIYTNETEFQDMRRRALNIITKNIDNRISKLGVSDYESKVITLSDGDYLVIEIGGLSDVEEAKKQIGKTVELEFKLLNPDPSSNPQEIAKRYSLTQDLFTQLNKNPQLFGQIVQGKASSDIFYMHFTGNRLEELPQIYNQHINAISKLTSGAIYPIIMSGLYHNFQDASGALQATSGFVIVKFNSASAISGGQISDSKVKSLASSMGLQVIDQIDRNPSSQTTNFFDYNKTSKKFTINAGELFSGQEAYKADLYIIPKTTTQDTASGSLFGGLTTGEDQTHALLVARAQSALSAGQDPANISGINLLVSGQWLPYDNIAQILPNYSYDPNNKFAVGQDLNATYIFKRSDHKASSGSLYRTLMISNVQEADVPGLIESLSSDKVYDIEEIFVRDHVTRLPALDSQSRLLNGAFFQMATVGQDSTGRPAVTIHFNEDGKAIFCDLTEKNLQKQMAIFVGGELKTAPTIQDKICGGQAIINGQVDNAERDTLIKDLNEGALPAQLILSHEETVDATLGVSAFHGALIAGLVGLILIFIYMIFLYGPAQAIMCMLMLCIYLVILLAFLKLIGYALSLSSIAAILLNIGISVDVCILIYERLKEELARGKSLTNAIHEAHHRSIPAIRDGNISIGLIGLLLFMLGINIFKGFGTMMIINLILTFVVVLPVIKEIMIYYYSKKQ